MSTIRMIGELMLNAAGWHTGLSQAEKAGNAFANRISHSLRNQLGAVFATEAITEPSMIARVFMVA